MSYIKNIQMKTFLKILLTALAVIVLANILSGVTVIGYGSAIVVAIVISLLNMFVKPLLIFFTLPATIVTFGLFIFVINAIIILLADKLVDGFAVSGFWTALLFSILLSIFRSFLFSLLNDKKKN
jgi:putative membrane protein